MEKKLYIEPDTRVLELAVQMSMLASATGTGSDLVSTGDYDGNEFDDLFD
jgi:hypothetical protein